MGTAAAPQHLRCVWSLQGIAAAAPTASSDEVQQLLELVQELWEQPPDEDVRLEVVRQLPGLGR